MRKAQLILGIFQKK